MTTPQSTQSTHQVPPLALKVDTVQPAQSPTFRADYSTTLPHPKPLSQTSPCLVSPHDTSSHPTSIPSPNQQSELQLPAISSSSSQTGDTAQTSLPRQGPVDRASSRTESPSSSQSSSNISNYAGTPAVPYHAPPMTQSPPTMKMPSARKTHVPYDPGSSRPGFNRSRSIILDTLRQPTSPTLLSKTRHSDNAHQVSVELVGSLRSAIQTLLHVSPPCLHDSNKEQYSTCVIQMPVTSVSSLMSSMRGLNYLSANLVPLVEGEKRGTSEMIHDFDIGELVQNVADQLSSEAAEAEVELVLSPGDVGMRQICVLGDRDALGYVLSHVVRQLLLASDRGDTIEIGLSVMPQSPSLSQQSYPSTGTRAESISDEQYDVRLQCTFEIVHYVSQAADMNATTPKAELNPFSNFMEPKEVVTPLLDTELCQALLLHAGAWLKKNTVPTSPTPIDLPRHGHELCVLLPRGNSAADPGTSSAKEEASRQPFIGLLPIREPSLHELSEYVESLRGRMAILSVSVHSVFAHHLTGLLTSWGLDVTPIVSEDNTIQTQTVEALLPAGFIMIDDDLAILQRELVRIKSGPAISLRQRSLKRPGLLRNAKSTSVIRQLPPLTPLIFFTSLTKYQQARDLIIGIGLSNTPSILVVPKPVGPRRLLVALFNAAKQPAFSPALATPRSPQLASGNRTPTGVPQTGFFDGIEPWQQESMPVNDSTPRTLHSSLMDESPPIEPPVGRPDHSPRLSLPTPGDVVATPVSEYFSRTTPSRTSGASGMVMQSPDGRPLGIFFDPPASARSSSASRDDGPRRKASGSRRLTPEAEPNTGTSSPVDSSSGSRRTSTASIVSGTTDGSTGIDPSRLPSRRKSLPTPADAKPIVAHGRDRSSTVTRRQSSNAVGRTNSDQTLGNISEDKVYVRTKSDVVVPPINVLIVEDNPINQNILSMFFHKKKIKYQTAKDGLEAVNKWKTGCFHLILMDIQLPVMDGIEATKEIRKLEKSNNIGVFPSTPVGEHQRPVETAATSPFRSAVIIVALTASSLQTDRVAALAAGCNDFLTKPVSLKWLEQKTVEWGCMQALIDFDGWRRWKGSDKGPRSETKRAFQLGPQAAAQTVANRLRIDRRDKDKGGRSASLNDGAHSPPVTSSSEGP